MDLGLAGRAHVLTGASRGLGLATAEALVADGARVVLSGRDPATAAAAAERLGPLAHGIAADLADPDTPHRLVRACTARWGRIDGMLISVGGPPAGGLFATAEEDWRAAFETVFLGALRAVRTVSEALGDGGAIVLVLSTGAREPIAGLAISNGMRPGLAMLAKEAATELGPRGIRVNALMPGRIDTDRVRSLDAGPDDRARKEAGIPLRRYGRPEEFGRVAAFLLSPAASYVTGALIPVEGGALHGP
ncbi:MAG: SDR family oxidoreductase [Thermoleophilia bacterium]|nr:SDR family oxidoreductase [Thermoleophilia bacterium]